MSKPQGPFRRFISSLLKIYRVFRSVILNVLFVFIVLAIFASMMGTPAIVVPNGAALVFAPQGAIVEEENYIAPIDSILDSSLNGTNAKQVLLQDVLDAIDLAANDSSINSLVLQLNSLQGAGFSKLQDIGTAINDFKTSGKKVYAIADSYTQGQYYLASYADEIIINPLGAVDIEGFSSYQIYYASALEKLGINMHIFRVGEFKSAVEPYERNDMSAEAKLANSAWLGDLWQIFIEDISRERELNPSFIQEFISTLDQQLANFGGDTAQLALQTGLVDSVFNRTEIYTHLADEIGVNIITKSYKQIDMNAYLQARKKDDPSKSDAKVALIIASGQIYDGTQRAGNIGGDSLSALIRKAREDSNVKALVLRIDSPGGSAFASEVIRNELLQFKLTGKPFIVSMGSTAASGGYMIAAPADQIWASPATITGSIGVFATYPTFENTFEILGINTDGVGTTPLAGATTVGRELPEIVTNATQLNIQNFYEYFLEIVAEGRDMSTEEVDAIAQGRVWSGITALDIGLVDHLGNLQQAISAAAGLASLDDYSIEFIRATLTPGEQFLKDISRSISLDAFIGQQGSSISTNNPLMNFYQKFNSDMQELLQLNDPRGMYARCLECQIQ